MTPTPEPATPDARIHLRKPADPLLSSSDHHDAWSAVHCPWDARDIAPGEGRKDHYRELTTNDVSAVTCHACLDEVVRVGEAAAGRVVELERAGCARSEMEIVVYYFDPRLLRTTTNESAQGRLVLHKPTGLCAYSIEPDNPDGERNSRAARLKLRAALGRLGPRLREQLEMSVFRIVVEDSESAVGLQRADAFAPRTTARALLLDAEDAE